MSWWRVSRACRAPRSATAYIRHRPFPLFPLGSSGCGRAAGSIDFPFVGPAADPTENKFIDPQGPQNAARAARVARNRAALHRDRAAFAPTPLGLTYWVYWRSGGAGGTSGVLQR
jgi:hypothetical protein